MRQLGMGLCLWLGIAAGVVAQPSSDKATIRKFLAHTSVRYGDSDDARSLEGRLYAWAKSGASMDKLTARAAKAFGMPDDVADALVPLVLQRGASEDDDRGRQELVERFIAVARTHPGSQLALNEAARTISAPFTACDIAAYERLLEGRAHADADRLALYDQFHCLPLLTGRTSRDPADWEPYLTLATKAEHLGNAMLDLAILRVADQRAQQDPRVPAAIRRDVRVRRITEELGQGYVGEAVALLPASPHDVAPGLHERLDADVRQDMAAAWLLAGHVRAAQAWRDDLPPAQEPHADADRFERSNAELRAYKTELLDRLLHHSTDDAFELLVRRHRLDTLALSGFPGALWGRLYDRIAREAHYPGLAEQTQTRARSLARMHADALRDCYRCAPDLLAMVDSVAAEGGRSASAVPPADETQLPADVRQVMDEVIAAPRPGWSEHPLPAALRQPRPRSPARQQPPGRDDLLGPPDKAGPPAPAWASRLPPGELVRYEQDGQRVVALTVSQTLDPTGEISAGGYWVSLSDDGGGHFAPPLYTGLRMFEPYVVVPGSKMPMLDGDRLQLEVAIRQLDDEHVMLPPIRLPLREKRDDLYVDIPLATLARDTDHDGLTDIAEWGMLLDARHPDTDGDGLVDGADPLPQVTAGHGEDTHAQVLVELLGRFLHRSLGAIVTTSATSSEPEKAHAITGSTDRYNEAETLFISAPAAYFSGITAHGRMIVLSGAQTAALTKARGTTFAMHMPVFEVSHDGRKALVVWSTGWTGGTFLLTREATGWKVEPLQQWIT